LLSYYFQHPDDSFALVARDHHERKEGSGYPRGIKLNDKLVEVVAVCDVYDALISNRPYRSAAFNNRTAIEVITEMGKEIKLNIDVIKSLVSINRKEKSHFFGCKVSNEKRGDPPLYNNYGIIKDDNN
jgi:HD-GYP domain-containing protein (c-di-GMP phosphodiesterase class II)